MKSDWWGFFGHKKACLREKKKPNKQKQNHQHKNLKTNQKNPISPKTKMNQPQNPAEHLHHWPTLPSLLTKNGERCRAGDLPAHLQHPFMGTDQLSFSGLIVAALTSPPCTPTPRRRSLLPSSSSLYRRASHVSQILRMSPRVEIVMRCSFRSVKGLCSFAFTDQKVMNHVLWVSTSPPHPSSEAGVTDPSHGTAGRMLGSANEGNRYRNAKNYQCLQQLPKSSSAAKAGWGGGTRCTLSSWFLQ